jgi:hypothetical protein
MTGAELKIEINGSPGSRMIESKNGENRRPQLGFRTMHMKRCCERLRPMCLHIWTVLFNVYPLRFALQVIYQI